MKWAVDIAPWNVEYGQQSSPVRLPDGVREGDAPLPWTITDEQREKYKEDGVLHIPGLLSKEWLEYLRGATDWQVENPHFWSTAGVASGMYDYIQRSIWASNDAFANFMYYSPLASALAGVADAKELRLSTDLLMVNPNSGFKWHQDNQNGPIDAFAENTAVRWWVTMDDSPDDHGYPVYLKGSHRNTTIGDDAVFVDLEKDGLLAYPDMLEFKPKAGDLLVWHSRSIHKIDGAPSRDWGKRRRRVLGGTVAVDSAKYLTKGRALFSDMGSHGLAEGAPLQHAYFPRIYPSSIAAERAARESGECTRTYEGMGRLAGNMFASVGEMVSWTKVLNGKDDAKKDAASSSAEAAPELEGKVKTTIPDWVYEARKRYNEDNDAGDSSLKSVSAS
jgi:hypothetical protein